MSIVSTDERPRFDRLETRVSTVVPSMRWIVRLLALAVAALTVLISDERLGAQSPLQAEIPIVLHDGTPVDLSFSTEPAIGPCTVSRAAGESLAYDCGDYTLDLRSSDGGGEVIVEFDLERRDRRRFVVHGYGARVTIPYTEGDGIWSFNHLPFRGLIDTTPIDRPFQVETSANYGIPFLVVVDESGRNRLAAGLLAQHRRVELRGAIDPEAATYRFGVTVLDAATVSSHRDGFFVSRVPASWFEAARGYARLVDERRGYVPLPIPASTYAPTYDTWYWTTDQIDQRLVWDLASRSRALGFESYLLDAGWDAAPGEYTLFVDGSTGDYRPPLETFPDFGGLMRRIRAELGMRVMFWMQQYALGRGSVYYRDLAASLSHAIDPTTGDVAETAALCPRAAASRRHIASIVERVARDYRPDAFWFDWQESVPVVCFAAHAHDEELFGVGYDAIQQQTIDVVRRDPDRFAELRWPYANLNNKPYAHMWQPFDTPHDFETMRLQAMALRPFSDGVVIGTDEMYWKPELSDEEAARFMAAVVFTGVPYFGPDLLRESETRGRMLAAWLRFYQEHREELTGGEFRPYGGRNHPDQIIESSTASFIYYGNRHETEIELTRDVPKIFVVNASDSDGIDVRVDGLRSGLYRAEISNLSLENTTRMPAVALSGGARLRYDVPVGCLLTLTHIRNLTR